MSVSESHIAISNSGVTAKCAVTRAVASRLHLRSFCSWLPVTKRERERKWWCHVIDMTVGHELKRHRQRLLRRTCCFRELHRLWEALADNGKTWKIKAWCLVHSHPPRPQAAAGCQWAALLCGGVTAGLAERHSKWAAQIVTPLWKLQFLLSLCGSAWVAVSDGIWRPCFQTLACWRHRWETELALDSIRHCPFMFLTLREALNSKSESCVAFAAWGSWQSVW